MSTFWDGSLSQIVAALTTRIIASNSINADGYTTIQDILSLIPSSYLTQSQIETLVEEYGYLTQSEIEALIPSSSGGYPYVRISDTKTGYQGGTNSSMTYMVRDINTIDADDDSLCTLGTNQFVLESGTYRVHGYLPAIAVDSHEGGLYDYDADTCLVQGIALFSWYQNNCTTYCHVIGEFTSTEQTLEFRHKLQTVKTNTGLGLGASWLSSNVFTWAEFWRLST